MLHILFLVFATSTLIFLYTRKRVNKGVGEWFAPNEELEKYYSMVDEGSSNTLLHKQLAMAASVVLQRQEEVDKERKMLYPLFVDRVISSEMWRKLEKADEDLGFERLSIEAESTRYKEMGRVFDAAKKEKREKREEGDKSKLLDALYLKKKEVLEKELLRRTKENKI